ncbi:MAG: alpha-2-macroglobulin family protein [Maritimibacter sp.]
MRKLLIFLSFVSIFTSSALAQSPLAERRIVLFEDVDFYGADLDFLRDVTLKSCESACLAQSVCTAFTYNARNSACFLKSDVERQEPYEGAISARVLNVPARTRAGAESFLPELSAFLSPADITNAENTARSLPLSYVAGGYAPEVLMRQALNAEQGGDLKRARRLWGAVTVLTDGPADWAEYARLTLRLAEKSENRQEKRALNTAGYQAAISGVLRATHDATRTTLLASMATGLEGAGRGRDTVQALRLAQSLQPRDDIARALERAVEKYGFRVADTEVQSELAAPRICATFSEPLIKRGTDYAPFVQSETEGVSVEVEGAQLCLAGLRHGARYEFTLREGLPAASGETLSKSVRLTQYVRDRAPSVNFPGRAYVLPRAPGAGLPIVSVNAPEIELTLHKVSDRSLLRTMQQRFFARGIDRYEAEYFDREMATQVWRGTASVDTELNQNVTRRLPMDEALAGQGAGIFVINARPVGGNADEPSATQWFVVSDIGLASMSGSDGLHVFARALGSAEALEGVEVELLSQSNAVLGTGVTDANGYLNFPVGVISGTSGAEPALLVARSGADDLSFLSLSDPEFDLSDRGVEGRPASPPIDVFLATDRGAYRAGETIFATVLARDSKANGIEGLPLTAILHRPDGVEFSRHVSQGVGAGGHMIELPVSGNAPRGTWRLEIHADVDAPALASTTVLVEDFLPERIDFDTEIAATLRPAKTAQIRVDARYLFGAPGAGLAAEASLRLRPTTSLAAYPGYVFGEYDSNAQPIYADPVRSTSDDSGIAELRLQTPEPKDLSRPHEASISVTVSENSGRPVERNFTRPVAPSGPVIGIKPGFEGELGEGDEARFEVLAVSPDLSTTSMEVTWAVNRVETRYQWYTTDGYWQWEPITTRTRVAQGEATLGDTPTSIVAPTTWGRYEVVVTRKSTPYLASSTEFYAGWYAAADTTTTPDMLDVSLDAKGYKPGDTAKLRFVPRSAGKALITVVSNRLIHMETVEAKQGENIVALSVTDDWGAGAYVTATLIQPLDALEGRTPVRALGLTHATVDPGAHQLSARILAPAEAKPRGKVEVEIAVEGIADGETAYVTLAAIDQGILNITGFTDPDPSNHYFGQRRLGVGLRDVYGRLIDGRNGAMGQVRSGGDFLSEMTMQAPPPTEDLMAQVIGPIKVVDGVAKAPVTLPEFNGSVRLMAIAWSQTGVGQAGADMLVRDPIVLTASLPRFLAPGDEARMLLELTHAQGPQGDVLLSARASGVTLGNTDFAPIPLAQGETHLLSVPLRAAEAGLQTITLALTTPSGETLTKTVSLPVQSLDPDVIQTREVTLGAGETFSFSQDVFDGLHLAGAQATLAAGPMARLDVPGLLTTLDQYPYGCTEQQTSRAMPLLYLSSVAEAMGLTADSDIVGRIQGAISAVLANQAASGSFGLWRAQSGDLWLDSYVTDFLTRAQAEGYDVPERARRMALDNLRNRVNYHPGFDSGGTDLAYALYVLAREGAAAMGDLRYYADVKSEAFSTPLASAQLGAALASYGDGPRADRMFKRAMTQIEAGGSNALLWRGDYGTELRDTAAVLALATEAQSKVIDVEALVARIAGAGKRRTTQEAVWTLMASRALLDDFAGAGLLVDGEAMNGPLVEVRAAAELARPMEIANTGADGITLSMTTRGTPLRPEPPSSDGYVIERRYFSMEGQPVETANLRQGTRLVTVVTVTPLTQATGRLMVADPLPAGFEIDNPNILRAGQVKALDWLNLTSSTATTEFRQDRFLAAVDLREAKPVRLAYIVRAVTPGSFHHPAASVEDMYRANMRATGAAGRVTITP